MKLVLEQEFTWDGVYGIMNDEGEQKYTAFAEITEKARRVRILNAKEEDVALIYQKRHSFKSVYEIYIGDHVRAKLIRPYREARDDYDTEVKDMMISGDVYNWDYIIVNKKGTLAKSSNCGATAAIEYYDEKHEILMAALYTGMMAMVFDIRDSEAKEAAGVPLSEREPVEVIAQPDSEDGAVSWQGAVDAVRDFAESSDEWAEKTFEAGKKFTDKVGNIFNKK